MAKQFTFIGFFCCSGDRLATSNLKSADGSQSVDGALSETRAIGTRCSGTRLFSVHSGAPLADARGNKTGPSCLCSWTAGRLFVMTLILWLSSKLSLGSPRPLSGCAA